MKTGKKNLVRDTKKDTIKDTIKMWSKNENKIFEEMQKNPRVTAEQLSDLLNINLRNTKRNIERLKEKGLIKRVGSRKTGHWEILDDG